MTQITLRSRFIASVTWIRPGSRDVEEMSALATRSSRDVPSPGRIPRSGPGTAAIDRAHIRGASSPGARRALGPSLSGAANGRVIASGFGFNFFSSADDPGI
jgi:hypothetical protein